MRNCEVHAPEDLYLNVKGESIVALNEPVFFELQQFQVRTSCLPYSTWSLSDFHGVVMISSRVQGSTRKSVTSYKWQFFDGSDTRSSKNKTFDSYEDCRSFSHIFRTRGLKRVRVTATNSVGSKTVSMELFVEGEPLDQQRSCYISCKLSGFS